MLVSELQGLPVPPARFVAFFEAAVQPGPVVPVLRFGATQALPGPPLRLSRCVDCFSGQLNFMRRGNWPTARVNFRQLLFYHTAQRARQPGPVYFFPAGGALPENAGNRSSVWRLFP